MQSLLRPIQVSELKAEKQDLERKLSNPQIQDKGVVYQQLKKLSHQLEAQTPRQIDAKDMDSAIRRSNELKEEILVGMPSQEEMRKSPPGAVDKHMRWEKRNKNKIEEWKNLQLRINHDSDERDIANFEKYRPTTSTLNMDNALIPGKMIILPHANAGLPVTFSDEQISALRSLNPEIADRLATLNNHQRQEVKKILTKEPIKKKREMSPENREKARLRMHEMHAKRKEVSLSEGKDVTLSEEKDGAL